MKPTRQPHDLGQNVLTANPTIFDKAVAGTALELDRDSPTRAPDQRCRQPGGARA